MIRRRPSREPGRHRPGQSPAVVHRRLWDGPARSEAERLDRSRPDWLVLYSLGTRRFYALAAWPVPAPLIVAADTVEGLEERMNDMETAFTWRTPLAASPPPSRRRGAPSQPPAAAPQHLRPPYRSAA